jgi:hypothetical protein
LSRHEAGPAPQLDRTARSGGRHRKPSSPGAATAVITTGTFAIVPFMMSAGTAQAAELAPSAGLDSIAKCESGGNPQAQNSGSTASGLYQFLDSSWKAYGGAKYGPRAKDATPAQQTEIAHSAVARSGLTPWAASQHCWGGKVSTANITTAPHISAGHAVTAALATRRPASTGTSLSGRHAAPTVHHAVPHQRKSSESAGHGTHGVHHGSKHAGTAHVKHKHLHPGEQLTMPRVSDLSLSGHSSA